MTERGRRRVIQLNAVDRRRMERGEPPSWLEPSGEPSLSGSVGTDSGADEEQLTNDQRLLEDVPPHWSPNRL